MKFGVQLPSGMEGLILPIPFYRSDDFLAMAHTAERLGYDSLWGNDHYAPQDYVRARHVEPPNFYDVFVVLAAVAAVTSRIQVGTSVLVLPMRDLVTVARQTATLDQVSGGRFLLGVSIGAYKEEYAAARPDLMGKHRGRMLEEGLELLTRLFREDGVTHRGEFYQVESLDLRPKPRQQPFPIYIGGHQERALERVIRHGQGWIPGWRPFEELREWIARLRDGLVAAGRAPESVVVAPQFSCTLGRTQEEAERRYLQSEMVQHRLSLAYTGRDPSLAMANNLIGSPETVLEKLERLSSFGVDHLSALTFSVNSVSEFSEQVHFFAEAVMRPFRLGHAIPGPTGTEGTKGTEGTGGARRSS